MDWTGTLWSRAWEVVAHIAGARTSSTALATVIYLGARVAHALSYTFAIPWVRTLAFSVGWGCQLAFAHAILMH